MLGIYCRISNKKAKRDDYSIDEQKESGIECAKALGLSYKMFVDKGISGTKEEITDRPEFALMIDGMEKGEITHVYCIDQSRLERNNLIWAIFSATCIKHDVEYYPSGKKLDLNDPTDKLVADVLSATNSMYAKLTGLKVSASIKRRVEQGIPVGMIPYGYKRDENKMFVIDEEQAKVVRMIYDLSRSGKGSYTIANTLNEKEYKTKYHDYGGVMHRKDAYTKKVTEFKKDETKWRGNVIHDMIINTCYKGEYRTKYSLVDVPAIVSPEIWEETNDNLQNNKKNVGKKEKYKYLLNGIIYCAKCGKDVVGKRRLINRDNSYKCKGKVYPNALCDLRAISIPNLESFIIKHLFVDKNLKEILINAPNNNKETTRLRLELKNVKKELKDVQRKERIAYDLLFTDDDFKDDKEIKKRITEAKNRKEQLEVQLENLERIIHDREYSSRQERTLKYIKDYTNKISFADLKRLIHGLIESIQVNHIKEEGRRGNHIIRIKYRDYEEYSTFMTDWRYKKWYWLSRSRIGATNEEELQEDRESQKALYEYIGVPSNPEELKVYVNSKDDLTAEEKEKFINDIEKEYNEGSEVSVGMHHIIELNEEDMVYFDLLPKSPE